jgi:hypothetical protein
MKSAGGPPLTPNPFPKNGEGSTVFGKDNQCVNVVSL